MDSVDASPWPAVTLTFDVQNLIRSSVGANEYSLSVLKNKTIYTMPLRTLFGGECLKTDRQVYNGGENRTLAKGAESNDMTVWKRESQTDNVHDLFKFRSLNVQLVKLLLTTLQSFQQVLIQILQLMILLLLVIRLQ